MKTAAADLDRTLLELPPAEKRRAFLLLARTLFPDEMSAGLLPIEVRDEDDRLIGYYVSFPDVPPDQFPPPSPEYAAELAQRGTAEEDTIPLEEFFTFPTSRSSAGQNGRKSSRRK